MISVLQGIVPFCLFINVVHPPLPLHPSSRCCAQTSQDVVSKRKVVRLYFYLINKPGADEYAELFYNTETEGHTT